MQGLHTSEAVNKILNGQLGHNIEVFVDDMIVKSKEPRGIIPQT